MLAGNGINQEIKNYSAHIIKQQLKNFYTEYTNERKKLSYGNAEYFHGPGLQISLQRRRSIEEEFQQAREEVDYVDVPNSLKQSRSYTFINKHG